MKTKWNPTKSEKRTHSVNAERLKSAGLVLGVANEASSEQPRLRIEQDGDGEIHYGTVKGMALAVWVRLTALKSGISLLEDSEVTILGCDDINFFWARPPERYLPYKMFQWFELDGGVVLNDRILSGRPLSIDRTLNGFLVAQSFDPLPSQYRSRMNIRATIRLLDQSGEFYTSVVELRIERHEQSVGRPEERSTRAGASYRHSSAVQDRELGVQDPRSIERNRIKEPGGRAIRSHV